jgi:hypothetical protein
LTTRTSTNPIGGRRIRQGAVSLMMALACLDVGCAAMGDRGKTLVPTRHQLRTGPFLIYSNTPIPASSASVRCLQSLENDLASRLDYHARPDEDPVEIYVLDDRDAFEHFLKFYYPELPPRRAFFLAQGDRRVVYTYQSPRLDEDLRHEATHALVRGWYGDVPLWLDEGLAEYFETPTDAIDAQHEHLARIPADLKNGWAPDLARLETLTDIHQMTPRDYRESWAWVHLMLSAGQPADSPLIAFLEEGRDGTGSRKKPLSQVLAARGTSGKTLLAHVESMQSHVVVRKPEPPAQDRLFRLQDRGPEPVVPAPPPPKPGLLRRIGMMLGF